MIIELPCNKSSLAAGWWMDYKMARMGEGSLLQDPYQETSYDFKLGQ